MSTRPCLAFVCGIEPVKNVDKDERYIEPDELDEGLEVERLRLGDKKVYFHDAFLDGGQYGGLPIGYKISKGDEDLARAFDLLWGAKTEDVVLLIEPTATPSDWEIKARAQREGADVVASAVEEGRWYGHLTPFHTNLYYEIALELLHTAGWTGVDRSMLKFFIVLYWE